MFDEPIKSIQQAKDYFRFMGCSHFHMAREYPQRYEEYKQLNISKQKETEWREEKLNEHYSNIIGNMSDISLWSTHSVMCDLVSTLKTDISLKKMLEVTQHIRYRVPINERVIVSETINGRSDRRYRSGLIYLAYDLDNITMAKVFAELSLHFSINEEKESQDFERCQSANKLCNDIIAELRL